MLFMSIERVYVARTYIYIYVTNVHVELKPTI